jgi:DNA-binding protein H-NS
MKGKIVDGEARERLIVWMRRRMEEFGITLEALAASIQEELDHPPLYRDARGNDWNGEGQMPEWLLAAKHAGVDPEFFRIEPERKSEAETETSLFRSQADLFD